MAQKRKVPRLYLRRRGGSTQWVIRHSWRMISTGFSEAYFDRADEVLGAYCRELGVDPGDYTPPAIMRRPGFVYFASCDFPDFPVKIGWASDVAARMVTLQCALPYRVVLLAQMPGTLADEHAFHIGYTAERLQGEWFKRCPDLMQVIMLHRVRIAA